MRRFEELLYRGECAVYQLVISDNEGLRAVAVFTDYLAGVF